MENVLDCGYGAASWAIEVAESYPTCSVCEDRPTLLIKAEADIIHNAFQVIGVDISPHMKPENTPENFWPQVCQRFSHHHTLSHFNREFESEILSLKARSRPAVYLLATPLDFQSAIR